MLRALLIAILTTMAHPLMADDLLYLTSEEGEDRLLAAEENRDYFALATYLEFEQILTFCGPASVAAVANSLVPHEDRPQPVRLFPWHLYTQDTLFNAANQALKPYAMVEHEGLTLAELDQFVENLGLVSDHVFAEEVTVDQFRDILIKVLDARDARMIVNYTRTVLPQDGGGHISPIGAYDADTDSVLILDVAKYKYPPVWISVAKMHAAMIPPDSGSNHSRGFVIVSRD